MSGLAKIPLPKAWPKQVCAAVVHAVALAHYALIHARSWCLDSRLNRVRLAAERDIARSKVRQLKQELDIKDARLARLEGRKRPQYLPEERLAILGLRAAAGWTTMETARRFQVAVATIARWTKRLHDEGPEGLLALRVPVNRFPDFVSELVRYLHAAFSVDGSSADR